MDDPVLISCTGKFRYETFEQAKRVREEIPVAIPVHTTSTTVISAVVFTSATSVPSSAVKSAHGRSMPKQFFDGDQYGFCF